MHGWIGVDLDGTLAEYHGWKGAEHIGDPIPAMVERVKAWIAEGKDVRIFTARAWPVGVDPDVPVMMERVVESQAAIRHIQQWCSRHIGRELPITCVKDYGMVALYDDRAVQVEMNTGRIIDGREQVQAPVAQG